MIWIRSARLASGAPFASLTTHVRRHSTVTRTVVAVTFLALIVALSGGGPAQAGLSAALPHPVSILPTNAGIGVATGAAVTLDFPTSMDRSSVVAALSISPAHQARVRWSDDGRHLSISPVGLWSTDVRYAVTIGSTARTAGGARLASPAQFSFTTQLAPRITDFQLHFVAQPAAGAPTHAATTLDATADAPADTASGVSATTTIEVTFSAPMNRAEVEGGFLLSPATPGIFHWSGSLLTFTPIERLAANARYGVSLSRVHDAAGNPLGGDASFSFTTRPGAQLLQSTPKAGATKVTDKAISLWFSQTVDPAAVGKALRVRDATASKTLTGTITWNATKTQLRFTPTRALPAGHRIDVSLAKGAVDADGNAVTASLSFTTKAAVIHSTRSGPPASSSLVSYALNQVNTARAAHGLRPLVLDARISAVSLAHAWDQIKYGYFSHTGRDGSTPQDRLRAAGISFGYSGENQCYSYNGARTTLQTLQWCHSEFMAEPWPGYANHIGNILSSHYTRVGIGIAVSGAKVIIVWDFID